jgi:lipopolysaccharide transport system ATP-binding protein
MAEKAIQVEGISKLYRIGARQKGDRTLRETLTDLVAAPVRRFRTLRGSGPTTPDAAIWALKDVSFDVNQGDAVAVIGRNGAGKSTLLKILSRITEPTDGHIRISGRVASLLEVGTGFHPELTGRENVYLNGAILGMRKAEIQRRFDDIVDFSEVGPFIDTPVKRYSSGMYVRLAFAVAAHLEPEILLVDEVLAVGDAGFQRKCLGKMSDVARQGRTVLFVSHNMAAVQNLCKTGIVISNGCIAFSGTAPEAVEAYLNSTGNKSYGFSDLSCHPGRYKGMQPILTSVALRSEDGTPYRTSFRTGEDVTFEIGYDCGDRELGYAMIGICSALGDRICSVGTHLSQGFSQTIRGRGILECHVPALPLAEGEYSLMVAIGTRRPIANVDYVEDAMRFHVEAGDYFGTGHKLLKGQGPLAQRSIWRVLEDASPLYASGRELVSQSASTND